MQVATLAENPTLKAAVDTYQAEIGSANAAFRREMLATVIAAHMPDAGENEADDGKRFPSDLSKSNAIKKTADGFTYLDPAQFHEYFAADLSAEQAAFMAQSQVFNAADNFKAAITTAAWRSKPSWMLVATKDRAINPDLERWYAERAKSHKVEVAGASHAVYVSRPKEVAALIEEAASARSIDKFVGKRNDWLSGCYDYRCCLHVTLFSANISPSKRLLDASCPEATCLLVQSLWGSTVKA